jgi:hypothetical protein
MEEKILTLHPQKKQGVNISKAKYDQIRAEIEQALRDQGPLGFGDLNELVGERLAGKFEGSIGWYFTTVKLDLEARGVIVCERKAGKAQMIRLA